MDEKGKTGFNDEPAAGVCGSFCDFRLQAAHGRIFVIVTAIRTFDLPDIPSPGYIMEVFSTVLTDLRVDGEESPPFFHPSVLIMVSRNSLLRSDE